MQTGRGTLTWAYVFFCCGALSTALGFWRAATTPGTSVARLAPEAVVAFVMLVSYVGGALLTERRLPSMTLTAARGSVLMLAGVGLLLASMLLNLR
jgi:hypothetical protein